LKNRYQLRQYIRFQLEQMSAKNQHHQFEELAFELARQRVSRNLIPATGPVQAGGDKGRDFETYQGLCAPPSAKNALSIAVPIKEPTFFGCTLQKQPVHKIKADLAKMVVSIHRPSLICYYAASDIPIANRHRLQEESVQKYGVQLQIFDGQAIADQLADPDIFWIAEQFLDVPSEFFPPVEAEDAYDVLRRRWITGDQRVRNYADFVEVKRGLRWSIRAKELSADTPHWITLLEGSSLAFGKEYWRKTIYELASARYKTFGSLQGYESTLLAYFSELDELNYAELEDGVALIGLLSLAEHEGGVDICTEDISQWRTALQRRVDELLSSDKSPNVQYRFLLTRANLFIRLEGENLVGDALRLHFKNWERAAQIAETTSLADIDALSNLLEFAVPHIGSWPTFTKLVKKVDRIVAERVGKGAVADNCFKRAGKYKEAGDGIAAVREMLDAFNNWFAERTMFPAAASCSILSQYLTDLNLPLAARFFSAIGLGIAKREDDDVKLLLGDTAFAAAHTYLDNGEGASFLFAAANASFLHIAYSPDPLNWERHTAFASTVARVGDVRALLAAIDPDLTKVLDEALALVPVARCEWWNVEEESQSSPFYTATASRAQDILAEQLGQGLFADVGSTLRYQWGALDRRWTITADVADRLIVERLGATLQLGLVQIADGDLVLLPGPVQINVQIVEHIEKGERYKLAIDGRNYDLTLLRPRERWDDEFDRSVFWFFLDLISTLSVLPDKQFKGSFYRENRKIGFAFAFRLAHPYLKELRADLLADIPDLRERQPPSHFVVPEPMMAPELNGQAGLGPGYSEEKAKKLAIEVYRRSETLCDKLLPKLRADAGVSAVLQQLRSEGWLDWHILDGLMLIVGDVAMEAELGVPLPEDGKVLNRTWRRVLRRLEKGDFPQVETLRFTKNEVEGALRRCMYQVLEEEWGMELRHPSANLEDVRRILIDRFGYAVDAPHLELSLM